VVVFFVGTMIGILLASFIGFFVPQARADDALFAPKPEEYADIQTWIPRSCCWSNKCCFKVKPSALRHVHGRTYEVRATGQKVEAMTSQDGQHWRCTCDFDPARGWVAHVKADTRCLAVPPQSF